MLTIKSKKVIASAIISSSVLIGVGTLTNSMITKQKQIEALEYEREVILSQNESLSNEKNNLVKEVDKLITDVNTLNEREQAHLEKQRELQNKNTELEKHSQSLEGQITTLKNEKNVVDDKNKYLNERVKYFENRNNQLVQENSSMADQLAAVEQQTKMRSLEFEEPKKIAVDIGHQLEGLDTGSKSDLTGKCEDELNAEVAEYLMEKLERAGYQVIDVTPMSANSVSDSLKKRREMSMQNEVDLFVSVHFNSFKDESANGVEVFVPSNASEQLKSISDNILKGFEEDGYNLRGTKDGSKYAVLKTNVENAILVECGFITSKKDMSIYDPEKIAENIFNGIQSGI